MYLWYFGPHISFNLAGEKNRYKCHAYHRALTQSCPLVSCLLMREGAMLAFPVLSRAHCISLAGSSGPQRRAVIKPAGCRPPLLMQEQHNCSVTECCYTGGHMKTLHLHWLWERSKEKDELEEWLCSLSMWTGKHHSFSWNLKTNKRTVYIHFYVAWLAVVFPQRWN